MTQKKESDQEVEKMRAAIAASLQQALANADLTKSEVARKMKTSRAQIDRILECRPGVTLKSLDRLAAVLGKRFSYTLE